MSKEEFNKLWKNSTKEQILNQYYYDYEEMIKSHNTIKEVREYIEKNKVMTHGHFDGKQWIYQYYELICEPKELLEILDKVRDDK